MERSVVTLNRFIVEEERKRPEATGAFSNILYDLTLAAKLISRAVNKAGLVDVLGEVGRENVHGDAVRKLDEYAHEVIFRAMDHGGHLCAMASEESPDLLPIPERFPVGPYVLLFDPLDGSGNIDANISIGTIFSILRRVTEGSRDGTLEDVLQPGRRQLAAGYVLYGSSTMLVYTTGQGVHGFTLDPSIGEFILSHPNIRIPEPGRRIYSVNEGHYGRWSPGQRRLVRRLRGEEGGEPGGTGGRLGAGAAPEAEAGAAAAGRASERGFALRYVGSLVADVHRTLLYGGLFMYPGDSVNPLGKLRLLYEVAPLAMVCEQAGGLATDGTRDILDIQPESLHQRTPLYIGSREYVELARRVLEGEAEESFP